MPVFNAARAASLATLAVVSLTIVACGSGGAPSTQARARRHSRPRPRQLPRPPSGGEQIRAPPPTRCRGEFRLGAGNQQPPGVVIPLAGSQNVLGRPCRASSGLDRATSSRPAS